jgi:hypothetical protein
LPTGTVNLPSATPENKIVRGKDERERKERKKRNVSTMKAGFRKEQLLEYWLLWSDRGCYGGYADCWYPSNQQLVPGSTVKGPYWVGPTGGRPQGTALPESTYRVGLKDIKDMMEVCVGSIVCLEERDWED